jgi:hypothetical protein
VVAATLGIWQGVAALENVAEILRASSEGGAAVEAVASNNLTLVKRLLARLRLGNDALGRLLGGIAPCECASAIALMRAALGRGESARRSVDLGFGISLGLFGAFFIGDDALHDYDLGAAHRNVFATLCVAFLAVRADQDTGD